MSKTKMRNKEFETILNNASPDHYINEERKYLY
jgi:hypothetical protein